MHRRAAVSVSAKVRGRGFGTREDGKLGRFGRGRWRV